MRPLVLAQLSRVPLTSEVVLLYSVTKKAGLTAFAGSAALLIAACGSSGPPASSSSSSSSSAAVPSISANSFTRDFTAMAVLKPLASRGKGSVGVILPDTVSSARYTEFDAPYLTRALQAAGLSSSQFSVQNAQGSDATELSDAQADITKGASVLIMDPLDAGVGTSIEKYAKAHGVAVIDYDRLDQGRQGCRNLGPAHRTDRIQGPVHRAQEHQRRAGPERRERGADHPLPADPGREGQDVPGDRAGRDPDRPAE